MHKHLCTSLKAMAEENQNRNKLKTDEAAWVSHLTPKQLAKMANLVGEKCLVNCLLNGHQHEVLWDTGAQVSIMTNDFLKSQFPDVQKRDISELLDSPLEINAANGTAIPYIGWAELEFKLLPSGGGETKILVPFLITSEDLNCPILGYNVIKEIVNSDCMPGVPPQQEKSACIKASFANCSESALNNLVEMIQEDTQDCLGIVKTIKRDILIPANSEQSVPCRAKTGYIGQTLPVLFEPDENTKLSTGLELHETLTSVKNGTKAVVQITVRNTTNYDILLRNRTVLGRLQLVKSAIPLEVKLRRTFENDHKQNLKEKSTGVTEEQSNDPKSERDREQVVRSIDLSGLTPDQRDIARNMLLEESESFACGDDDIGYIPDLSLNIDLSDPRPVQKNYTSIPRPLYQEVKHHIEDLLNK